MRETSNQKDVELEVKPKFPKISNSLRHKLKGIPYEIIANIYVQPKGVVDTISKFFPDLQWVADTIMYPVDWIYNKKRKSIFDRKWFHVPTVLNPPYAEIPQSKASPRHKEEKPLKFHIAHILQVARDSQIPTAILLPWRPEKNWQKKLQNQPDVATMYFQNPLQFQNAEGNLMPPAKFRSWLAIVGVNNTKIQIKNNSRGFCI